MSKYGITIIMTLLRVALGWLFFYAGITKVVDPEWTAKGFLGGAKTLQGFYGWLASQGVFPIVDFVNEWGLTLLGISLIFGVFVRLSAPLGAVMMILYWLPILDELKPNAHAFIVDEHIVYALTLLLFAAVRAGRHWGLDAKLIHSKFNSWS